MTERWPPIYDAEELRATIRQLADEPALEKWFFQTRTESGPYQGDILEFSGDVPWIDENGDAAVLGTGTTLWIVLGNSCDITRDVGDSAWIHVAPLFDVGSAEQLEKQLEVLRRYTYSRRFYVPPWDRSERVHVAEFGLAVPASKVFVQSVPIAARLSRRGWYLLHACLVRFLCRDDGRFDEV